MEVLLFLNKEYVMGDGIPPSVDHAVRATMACLRVLDCPKVHLSRSGKRLPVIREVKTSELEKGKGGSVEVVAEIACAGVTLRLRCELLYERGWRLGPFMSYVTVSNDDGEEILHHRCTVLYNDDVPEYRPWPGNNTPR